MKKITFPFIRERSKLFGYIDRPVAKVEFWSSKKNQWYTVLAIVDSGADYTLLPIYFASILDVDLKKDCKIYFTAGVGGSEKVFLHRNMAVKIGPWQSKIPVGFLNRDDIPPLLGRQECLNKLGILFFKRKTTFILD